MEEKDPEKLIQNILEKDKRLYNNEVKEVPDSDFCFYYHKKNFFLSFFKILIRKAFWKIVISFLKAKPLS